MCEGCGCHEHESIYMPEPLTVVQTHPMTERDRFFEFKLNGKTWATNRGQFAEISIPGIGERAISVSSSPTKKGSFEMVIRKVGKVTAAFHDLKPGDTLWRAGPVRHSLFPVTSSREKTSCFSAPA